MSEELVDDVVEADGRYSMTDLIENGDDRDIRMILGNRDRIRPAGKIRPGIKSPVGSCSAAQKALYEKMLADNIGFDAIDAELLKLEAKGSTRKSCLRPSNCDYFVIRDEDFSRASDAQLIRSKYADSDGKVRRIPVWFLMSERHRAIPHAFTAFDGGGNLRCVSFYDGDKLKFRYLPREIKAAKPEDWKVLDSENEDEATKACGLKVSLTGAYHIQVPGVRSVGGVLVNTKSWYGLSDAMAVINEVRKVMGRFDGLFHGEPFFELVKVVQTMKVEGKTTKQWIVTLELSVDMMELARYAEPQAVAARSANALSLLTGRQTSVMQPSVCQSVPDAPAAMPDPGPPVGAANSGDIVKPDYDHAAAARALSDLISPHGLTLEEMEIYSASQGHGQVFKDMSKAEMTDFYKIVRAALKEDAENFVGMVREIAGTVPVNEADPF